MQDSREGQGYPFFTSAFSVRASGLLKAAMIMVLSGIVCGSPLHKNKTEITVNLSQGYRHGDTVFFLADIHRYRPGRTFWFILPLKAEPKTLSHQTRLYSLETKTSALKMEAVLSDPAEPTCMVNDTKWILRDGTLYFSYNPSNRLSPETGHTQRAVFGRHMASGAVAPAPEPEKVHDELFAGYKSPYRDNPGVTEISAFMHWLPAGWDKELGQR